MRVLFAVLALGCSARVWGGDWVDYVLPLMGCDSTGEFSCGNTYPVIARPWGMNAWAPMTGAMGNGWIYSYRDKQLRGIKQTHQPSPWIGDYGQFAVLPTTGKAVFKEDERKSWFSHKAEVAKPYYYSVYLADYDTSVEVSPTARAAMLRVTWPMTDSAAVVLDAFDKQSYVKVEGEKKRIVGWSSKHSPRNDGGGVPKNFKCYFVVEFDRAFSAAQVWDGEKLVGDLKELQAAHTGGRVEFPKMAKGEQVHIKVASSFISIEQAERNLKELGNDSFDVVREKGRAAWNEVLGKIAVEGGTVDQMRVFYTCLYRSVLFPREFYELDGEGKPYHRSPITGEVCAGYYYTDTGFWDTFRALFPLLNLVYPSVNARATAGLEACAKESGWLPEWASPGFRDCMIGNNSASVVADAWLSGVREGYDINALWQALLHGATNAHPTISAIGRKGTAEYVKLGYVPRDIGIRESAARTLEYAYNDWCIWKLGEALGKPKEETQVFAERAMNYQKLYNPAVGLMSGRQADGAFDTTFDPVRWGVDFTEGNSLHYTWSVFHDIEGLIKLMGGREKFAERLDSIFSMPPVFALGHYPFVVHEMREMQVVNFGQYAHGNQPAQHVIYLYSYANEPWKTQYWVREALNRLYTPTPDGYCGDEDNGQTSAWYVWSALGFYPVCPGAGQYVLGAPLFKKATVTLENGKQIIINAPDNSPDNRYVNTLRFNGKNYTHNYLDQDVLKAGAVLDFDMSDKPNTRRGIAVEDRPYSWSKP